MPDLNRSGVVVGYVVDRSGRAAESAEVGDLPNRARPHPRRRNWIWSLLMPWRRPRGPLLCVRSKRGLSYRQWRLRLGSDCTSPRFHLSARLRALPLECECSAKRYPADAFAFGMQYRLGKLREPVINENSCGRRSRLNSRGFARCPKKTHA
jgi:hypothetical protein